MTDKLKPEAFLISMLQLWAQEAFGLTSVGPTEWKLPVALSGVPAAKVSAPWDRKVFCISANC